MPALKYIKPKSKVIDVYSGKEMRDLIQSAMEDVFLSDGIQVTQAKVKRFLSSLAKSSLLGDVVIIIEKLPLIAMEVHGKMGDKIYARVGKTGNQYVKAYKKPHNPRTELQQNQRGKYAKAVNAWNSLPESEKEIYCQKAKDLRMSGYNLFIRNTLHKV